MTYEKWDIKRWKDTEVRSSFVCDLIKLFFLGGLKRRFNQLDEDGFRRDIKELVHHYQKTDPTLDDKFLLYVSEEINDETLIEYGAIVNNISIKATLRLLADAVAQKGLKEGN